MDKVMTDKEQIIIDGMEVSKCQYLNTFSDCEGYHYYCDLADDIKNEYCEHYKDCYFKQLARKTQECEELKKQLMQKDEINTFFNSPIEGFSSDPCGICKYKDEYSRYRKALEEIEEFIEEEDWSILDYVFKRIKDIISKAKGG